MHETEVKGILSDKNGINIYRGCTHGCIYCDSRSKCYQMHHDFEDIEVKLNEETKCVVQMTLTTYDEALCKIIEPATREWFEVITEFLR